MFRGSGRETIDRVILVNCYELKLGLDNLAPLFSKYNEVKNLEDRKKEIGP